MTNWATRWDVSGGMQLPDTVWIQRRQRKFTTWALKKVFFSWLKMLCCTILFYVASYRGYHIQAGGGRSCIDGMPFLGKMHNVIIRHFPYITSQQSRISLTSCTHCATIDLNIQPKLVFTAIYMQLAMCAQLQSKACGCYQVSIHGNQRSLTVNGGGINVSLTEENIVVRIGKGSAESCLRHRHKRTQPQWGTRQYSNQ